MNPINQKAWAVVDEKGIRSVDFQGGNLVIFPLKRQARIYKRLFGCDCFTIQPVTIKERKAK